MMLSLLTLLLGCVAASTAATGGASLTATTVKSYENDTVTLPCRVEDLGLQTRVRWWRAGVLLADSAEPAATAANPRVKMWGNQSLELVQVRPEDSGEYVCQATRPEPWGHVTQVHEIQVMYPASAKPIPESGQLEVRLGDEAEMSCISEGVPKPVLAWSFQGEELPILASGQRLRIHATNRSLAGVYTCTASNGIGEPAKANIELRVKHKPEVTATRRWLHTSPGIRVQLECLVISWPEAEVDWQFEGQQLARSKHLMRYMIDAPASRLPSNDSASAFGAARLHLLVIRSVLETDLGSYTCRATNELGSAELGFEVSGVPGALQLRKGPRTGTSDAFNFIWTAESYSPMVEYQFWFRQLETREEWHRLYIPSEQSMGPMHVKTFNLTGLKPSRQYEALVLARNKFGSSSPSKILRFATVPATAEVEEDEDAYKTDSAGHEQISPAVQVTSDSHRSSDEVNSSGPGAELVATNRLLALLLALLLLVHRPS